MLKYQERITKQKRNGIVKTNVLLELISHAIKLLLNFFKWSICEKEATISFKMFRHEMEIFESFWIRVSSHNNLHYLILAKEKPAKDSSWLEKKKRNKKIDYFESLHSAWIFLNGTVVIFSCEKRMMLSYF